MNKLESQSESTTFSFVLPMLLLVAFLVAQVAEVYFIKMSINTWI